MSGPEVTPGIFPSLVPAHPEGAHSARGKPRGAAAGTRALLPPVHSWGRGQADGRRSHPARLLPGSQSVA